MLTESSFRSIVSGMVSYPPWLSHKSLREIVFFAYHQWWNKIMVTVIIITEVVLSFYWWRVFKTLLKTIFDIPMEPVGHLYHLKYWAIGVIVCQENLKIRSGSNSHHTRATLVKRVYPEPQFINQPLVTDLVTTSYERTAFHDMVCVRKCKVICKLFMPFLLLRK